MIGLGDERERGVGARGGLSDDVGGFGCLGGGEDGDAGFDDAGFFGGDGGEGITEPLLVVHADGGDEGDDWGEGVGGVETPAHAGFEDDGFSAGAFEPVER